jgi:hypothetical protein
MANLRTKVRIRQTQVSVKDTCRAATTANIADLAAGAPDTLDGVSLAAGDRILVKNQTTASENGIYNVDTLGTGVNGAWSRAEDMQVGDEIEPGVFVAVREGTLAALREYMVTDAASVTVDTDDMTWTIFPDTSGLTDANFIIREVPTGAVNGTNQDFVLANTPTAGTEEVYLNGLLQNVGASNDYTISGATITFNDPPKGSPGNPDIILVSYRI